MTTATETLPLPAQAIWHLTEMAQFQTDRDWDLTWSAWGLLRDLDYSPVDGERFEALWAEYVRVSADLRKALADGDSSFWSCRVRSRELLVALIGGAA